MWTCGFYRYEHVYIYRRKEFKNNLEIILCSYFGQLLFIYWKIFDYGIEHDVDRAYGVHSWTLHYIWLYFAIEADDDFEFVSL